MLSQPPLRCSITHMHIKLWRENRGPIYIGTQSVSTTSYRCCAYSSFMMSLRVCVPYLDGVCSLSSYLDTDSTHLIIRSQTLGELLTNGCQQQLLPHHLLGGQSATHVTSLPSKLGSSYTRCHIRRCISSNITFLYSKQIHIKGGFP